MTRVDNRLPLHFRQQECRRLFGWILAGESGSIYGISGVGKSNLFNHLLDDKVQKHYLGSDSSTYIFVRANFHYLPDFEARSVYGQILESLEFQDKTVTRLTPEELEGIREQHEKLLDAGDDSLRILRHFKLAVHSLLAGKNRRLVILLDQFDNVYKEGSSRLFATLRGLREAFKYSVSYLTFTRDVLTNLAELDQARDEFFELFASNTMALTPYTPADAHLVLERVFQRNQATVDQERSDLLVNLSGGHAGLLRAFCMILVNESSGFEHASDTAIPILVDKPAVRAECGKIWNNLSVEERKALAAYLSGVSLDIDVVIKSKLQEKGIITIAEDGAENIFSPVFAAYIRQQDMPWEREIYWDTATYQVWVLGRATEPLTAQESRLFRILYNHPNEVITKEELIEAGWPTARGGVSDEALGVAISRLRRKIEPNSDEFRYIENIREHGYRLRLE